MTQADSHDTTTNVVKFPYNACRHVQPEERSAKAALTLAQAVAATNPDPAFTLIAEKLAADVAQLNAIDESEDLPGGSDVEEAACYFVHDADWRLATTPPTTLDGVAAVLRFANEIEDAGMEWPDTDTIGPEGWHYQLRATMAAALESIIQSAEAQS